MNFCGGDYDVHLDQATSKVSNATLCGPCVKDDENLDAIYTDDEDEEEFDSSRIRTSLQEEEKKFDSDDLPFADAPGRIIRIGSTHSTPGEARSRATATPPSAGQRMGKFSENSTPSPMYLNPMGPTAWEGQKDKANDEILCPTLEPPNTMDKVLERLKKGFCVTVQQEGSRNGKSAALLYLDEAMQSIDLKWLGNRDDSQPWCSLPVDKILRLEIKGKRKNIEVLGPQQCSFTIIVNQNARISYHDFEVDTSIERELIVSTLMIVLDRLQRDVRDKPCTVMADEDAEFELDGTEDQPIPCSPSLEQHTVVGSSSCGHADIFRTSREGAREDIIHLEDLQRDDLEDRRRSLHLPRHLPRRRPEHFRSKSSSPKSRREKLYRQASEGYGAEDFEIVSQPFEIRKISSTSTGRSRLRRSTQEIISSPRSSPEIFDRRSETRYRRMAPVPETMGHDLQRSSSLQSRNSTSVSEAAVQPNAEDLIVEFAASGHLTSPWCTDDTCTLALKDFADTCSNMFASGHPRAGCSMPGGVYEQQRMLEEYIASALGAPSAFYTYITESERWASASRGRNEAEEVNARVRNRSGVMNAQARRFRRLRGEMTFSAALKKSHEVLPYIQTTRSFNDELIYRKQAKQVAEEGASQFHSSGLLQHVVSSMRPTADPSDDEVVYYDSDPEDARSHSLHKKCPRQVAAQFKNYSPTSLTQHHESQPDTGFGKVKSIRRVSKKLEEDVIVQIVQTMTNDRMTLIWHPTQETEGANRSPLCVKVWIESGVCLLDGTFVLPKLSWTRVIDKTEGELGAKSSRRLPPTEPRSVDLLDICRVYSVERIDRKCHPFADARKSFFVETQSESFLFESLTTEERNRIVYGLKLVIARLASMLMLRDARAAEEFFGAVAPSVPGEAPEWAQGSSTKKTSERMQEAEEE